MFFSRTKEWDFIYIFFPCIAILIKSNGPVNINRQNHSQDYGATTYIAMNNGQIRCYQLSSQEVRLLIGSRKVMMSPGSVPYQVRVPHYHRPNYLIENEKDAECVCLDDKGHVENI